MSNMLSVALKEITGPLNQLFINLAGENGQTWFEEFKKFLRKEPCWPKQPILEFLGAVTIPARTERFFAKEKFVVNAKPTAPVKIGFISDTFTQWFGGKIEDPMTQQALRCAKLRKSSVDRPIIEELGGEKKAETTLAEVYALTEQQPNGEDGILLTNGYANIFYVRDVSGVLRAVRVHWRGDGWYVHANLVDDLSEWHGGNQVFSRNS